MEEVESYAPLAPAVSNYTGPYNYPVVAGTAESDDDLCANRTPHCLPPCALCCPARRMGAMFVLREDEERGIRCVVGPCWPMLCVTFSLIIVPSIGIFAICGAIFVQRFAWALFSLPILACAEFVVVTALAYTAFSDPGVAPRYSTHPLEEAVEAGSAMEAVASDGGASASASAASARAASSVATREALGHKWSYSKKAQSWRRPGVVYCSESCVLVEEIDHFCPWTGTTIGKKNLRYFNCFTSSLVVYLIAACLVAVLGGVIYTDALQL